MWEVTDLSAMSAQSGWEGKKPDRLKAAIARRPAGTRAALTSYGIRPPPRPLLESRHSPTGTPSLRRIRFSSTWFSAKGAAARIIFSAVSCANIAYVNPLFSGRKVAVRLKNELMACLPDSVSTK